MTVTNGPDRARQVVVAVGNDPVDRALAYAATEALRSGCGLKLVHVFQLPVPAPEPMVVDFNDLEAIARATLAAAVEQANELVGGSVPVTGELVHGPVVAGLVHAASDARVVVLQRRRLVGMLRAVTRSTSSGVAAHARTPVVSVPSGWVPPTGAHVVTVGVDVPDQARLVLEAAAGAARERGADLHVLHTWWLPSVYEQVIRDHGREDAWQGRARDAVQRVVDELSADPGNALADVPVRVEARRAHAADALLAASHDSELVVVGRHDPLVPLGSHLGPIARAVLRDAECPVMLVDPRAPRGRRRAVAAHAGTATA